MAAQEDAELRHALAASTFNVPDGMPLVWALNMFGHSLRDRVYGPELMARACARASENGQRFYLYGGRNQGALVQLALNLRTRYPGVRIVGGYSPPHRPLTADEQVAGRRGDQSHRRGRRVGRNRGAQAGEVDGRDARAARRTGPDRRRRGVRLPCRPRPQAPPALQKIGLEWAYRLVQEPRRLWRRYLRYNPRFVLALARQVLAHRLGGAGTRR